MKIAIVKLSALGDIIHAMVVLQFVKKYNKEIIIDWVVEESYKDLLVCNPDINKVHTVNIKKVKKKKSIRLLFSELLKVRNFGKYDLVIDMQGLIKSALISRLLSSPVTIGFDKSSSREGIASFFYNKTFKSDYADNVVIRNFQLIKFAIGFNYNNEDIIRKMPFLYPINFFLIPSTLKNKKNIVLVPGASHPSKRYPLEKLAELSLALDANFLIIWGSQEEKILANKIKVLSPEVCICEKLPISSLISLIKQADLVIGSDTGPTHIAWALNKSSITLFGPTPGYRNAFATNINKYIESDSKVNPLKIDKKDYSIKNIKVEEIVKIAEHLSKLN